MIKLITRALGIPRRAVVSKEDRDSMIFVGVVMGGLLLVGGVGLVLLIAGVVR